MNILRHLLLTGPLVLALASPDDFLTYEGNLGVTAALLAVIVYVADAGAGEAEEVDERTTGEASIRGGEVDAAGQGATEHVDGTLVAGRSGGLVAVGAERRQLVG